jgi:hypothetical protein
MMYSFGNRSDCEAWDEPFYGFALQQGNTDHPMRDEIIADMETDWDQLVKNCITPSKKPLLYQKHMTHHMLPGFDRSFIHQLENAFLIRRPEKVLASYTVKWADVDLRAIGFVEQAEIFDDVAQRLGHAPAVIDSDDVLANPRGVLSQLCKACGIPFDEAMLHWPKGPKPFDGIWAKHWYDAVWKSEGFAPASKETRALPALLEKIADQAQPYYDRLKQYALSGV